MNSQENHKGAYQELWSAFTKGPRKFINQLHQYYRTSIAIVGFHPIFSDIQKKERKYLPDIKYAYLIFECILILFIFSKLLGEGVEMQEIEELVQEFLLLILYFIELILVLMVGQVFHTLLFQKQNKRVIQELFLYAFCLPFLPSYLITYIAYDTLTDEETFNMVLLMLFIGTMIFYFFYFYQLTRALSMKIIQALVVGTVLAIAFSVCSLLSVAIITGATYGESA